MNRIRHALGGKASHLRRAHRAVCGILLEPSSRCGLPGDLAPEVRKEAFPKAARLSPYGRSKDALNKRSSSVGIIDGIGAGRERCPLATGAGIPADQPALREAGPVRFG